MRTAPGEMRNTMPRIAIHAKRAALEEVGGGLLDWTEREHPDQVDAIRGEIDAFFASLPERQPTPPDQFIAELRAGLPPEAAEQAPGCERFSPSAR